MRPLAALLVLVLGLCQAASAEQWSRLVQPADGFEVEFSGSVTAKPTELSPGIRPAVIRATTYQQHGSDFIFAVGVQRNKRELDLDSVVDASFATLQCMRLSEPEPLPVRAHRARELRGESCLGGELTAILRHYTRDRLVYQVLAIFPAARRADARRFLDSFKLIEPSLSIIPNRGRS